MTDISRRRFHHLAGAAVALLVSNVALIDKVLGEEAEQLSNDETLRFVDGSFTIVALPDTQHYLAKWPHHFYKQTEWIVANRKKRNIQFVVHLGDITNRNTPEEWEIAHKAMSTLDGVVPYSVTTGNHDCGVGGRVTDRQTPLNDFFSIATAQEQPTFGGIFEDGRLENNYHTFQVGDQAFLILSLEWGPRDQVVEWANRVVEDHPHHATLLVTHAYLYYDDTRYDWPKYGERQRYSPHHYGTANLPGGTNDGQQLWEKLVSQNSNLFMTINGHVPGDGLGLLTSNGKSGNRVHQMLVNYQHKAEAGEGYLRLLEFPPDGKTVQVKSYSPSTNKYKTDTQNQYVLTLEPPLKL